MSLLELKSAALDCEFILCFILPNFCPNLHLFSPNKLAYPDFKARYNIIGAAAVAKAKNDKAAGQAVMDIVKLDKDKYRLGHTKVFIRMEEQRENKIGSVLAWLHAYLLAKTWKWLQIWM